MKFPQKKANTKDHVVAGAGEALTSQFKLDFILISCMEITIMDSMWHLYNNASFDMTRNKYLFSDLEEKHLKQNIEFGDDGRYNTTIINTINFQREHVSPLRLTYVMYVPGLNKNLVSVTVLEDRGYDVIFNKGKVFLRNITMI